MSLTDREKEQIKAMIDRGEPLPPRYRSALFAEPHEIELIWPGKTAEITNVVLPFQSIEQIDEPRAETAGHVADLFAFDALTGRQSTGWTNKLVWGDNKLVLAALNNGSLRRGLKLVYIDPPFDVGADFSFDIEVGEGDILTKIPSVIEDVAYRDTWGRGVDSYVAMIYERLRLIHGLLDPNGSIYIHCDWRVSGPVRLCLDEIFGYENNIGSIVWKRTNARGTAARWPRVHDSIFHYAKGDGFYFKQQLAKADAAKLPHTLITGSDGLKYQTYELTGPGRTQDGESGRPWRGFDPGKFGRHWSNAIAQMDAWDGRNLIHWPKDGGFPRRRDEKPFDPEDRIVTIGDVWADIDRINQSSNERLGYETQKPEALLARIIDASSRPGDLVGDFFCGAGTTLAVSEKLGRKWIGCDLGRFAIHTSRKRLIGVQRELKEAGRPYRSFEILNLGKYERQFFVGIDPTLPEEQRLALSLQKEEHYLTLILNAYKAERSFQTPPFHGRKSGALVIVGPIDAPVTQGQVGEAVEAARKLKVSRVDLLGFEFEMGIVPHAQDQARAKGVNLALRYIPKDVFDRRAVEKGQVTFYDVAYVELQPVVKGRSITVKLKDFGVYYRQEDIGVLTTELKAGASKVTVDVGQVVKLTKDKKGVVTREVLTKSWADWIDYWAVDFGFEDRREIIRMPEADGTDREVWTGGYIFENEWQSFRTRKDRALELASGPHEYPKKGRYKVAVKVIDIFGNDTTKVVEVTI
jgi:adenine-specific DNA-methyltransferase